MSACLSLAACHRVPGRAPPRAGGAILIPPQTSVIDVPVGGRLGDIATALDRAMPQTLWTIDKANQTCVPPKTVKVLFARIKTPKVSCRITGEVTRGPITIEGRGQRIGIVMPLRARISARDVGHVLAGETAVGTARVRADLTFDVDENWTPRGTADIHYDWTDEPHVDFLGQRIEFTSKADAKLGQAIARLERTLPQQLAKLRLRDKAQEAWNSAFTAIAVNKADPPVWIRIAPRAIGYGGYAIEGDRLVLKLGMTAATETVVGPRPPDPKPTPLPKLDRGRRPASRIVLALPVIAAYDQLEPIVAKALAKRAARPFDVPGVGEVRASFGKVTIYGTTGGRIAVGLAFSAGTPGSKPARGTVWLTARPVNQPDSRRVAFSDLAVSGVTDSSRTSLLLRIANAPGLSETIAGALTQNFSGDYAKLLDRIGRAIAVKRAGDLVIRARIDDVRTGRLQALGPGVYLPVWGRGTASVSVEAR